MVTGPVWPCCHWPNATASHGWRAACLIALELGTTKSSHVRDILVNGRDLVRPATTPDWVSPAHANVRGAAYYQ